MEMKIAACEQATECTLKQAWDGKGRPTLDEARPCLSLIWNACD